jgi:hypothetical protein
MYTLLFANTYAESFETPSFDLLFVIAVVAVWILAGIGVGHFSLKGLAVTLQNKGKIYGLITALFCLGVFLSLVFALQINITNFDVSYLRAALANSSWCIAQVILFWFGFSFRYFSNGGWLEKSLKVFSRNNVSN